MLKFRQVASSTPYDPTGTNFTSTNIQEVISEIVDSAGSSRYSIDFSYNGNAVATKYLQLFLANPSDGTPYITPETGTIKSMAIATPTNTTATVTVYKNGSSIDTITLTGASSNYKSGLNIPVAPGDKISAAVTSGSIQNPGVSVQVKVD